MPKKTLQRVLDTRRQAAASGSGLVYVGTTPGGGGGGTDHGLLTGLGDDDHPLYALKTIAVTAGAGLTGTGTLATAITLAVGAGDGITVGADSVALASSSAGAGLTYTSGVLAVGAGNGLTVAADAIALTTPGTLTVSTTNAAAGSHTHAITSSSNPGANERILASTGTGGLTLVALAATTSVNSPLLTTTAADGYISPNGTLRLEPTGDVIVGPGGGDMHPLTNYAINLGLLNRKWLTLHAAELWVETLVAQNTIATIGGRILVGPTNLLTADLGDDAGDTTITVKYNNFNNGDRVYMEANGKIEWMAVASVAGGSAGAYTYTVTRNLDGTGLNVWYAGDAVFDTGTTGNGFIDQYSLYGIPKTGQTSTQRAGPTIVGNVRLSATYSDIEERWAIGNLNGLYGYATNLYGFAAGDPDTAWVSADASNGFRTNIGSTVRFQVTAAGNLRINDSTGANVIALDSDGTSYFAGPMTLGTGGGIYQGTGTFASPTTGLKIWRDSGIGRIGGYNTGTLQWYGDTDGKFRFGVGTATIDAAGLSFSAASNALSPSVIWVNASAEETLQIYSQMVTNSPHSATYVSHIGSYLLNSDLSLPGIGASVMDVGGLIAFESINNGSDWNGYLTIKAGKVGAGNAKIYLAADMLDLTGNITSNGATTSLGAGLGTTTALLRLGYNRTDDGASAIYFTTDNDTYTDYGFRIVRAAAADGTATITHRGTGLMQIMLSEAAAFQLSTSATKRFSILSDGLVGIGNITPTSKLDVDGNIRGLGLFADGEGGGVTGTTGLSNGTSTVSSGTGTVKLAGTTARNSDLWLKFYVGTTPYYVPAWSNIS